MAVSYVNRSSLWTSASSGSASAPTGSADGDLLLVIFAVASATDGLAISSVVGMDVELLRYQCSLRAVVLIGYTWKVGAGGQSVTLTTSGGSSLNFKATCATFRGVSQGTPVSTAFNLTGNGAVSVSANDNLPITAPQINVTLDGSILVHFGAGGPFSNTSVIPSAKIAAETDIYTQVSNGSRIGFSASYKSANSGVEPAVNFPHDDGLNYQRWVGASLLVNPAVAPTAGFSVEPESGTAPLTVQVTDESSGSPTSYNYDWGDGSDDDTTAEPSHEYTEPGEYTITQTVTNETGSDETTQVIEVTAASAGMICVGRRLHGFQASL